MFALQRAVAAMALLAAFVPSGICRADNAQTIERVKASVVEVGTFERTRTPQFQFLGTGFAVGDGTLIATNAHVVPKVLDPARQEILAILLPSTAKDGKEQGREAKQIAVDAASDVALLRVQGPPLPALTIGDSDAAKEGQDILFTG